MATSAAFACGAEKACPVFKLETVMADSGSGSPKHLHIAVNFVFR